MYDIFLRTCRTHITSKKTKPRDIKYCLQKREGETSSLPSFDMTKLLLSHDNYHNGSMKIPIFLFANRLNF